MNHDLTGQVALVTGASTGLGKAIAIELGRRGAKVRVAMTRSATRFVAQAFPEAQITCVDLSHPYLRAARKRLRRFERRRNGRLLVEWG